MNIVKIHHPIPGRNTQHCVNPPTITTSFLFYISSNFVKLPFVFSLKVAFRAIFSPRPSTAKKLAHHFISPFSRARIYSHWFNLCWGRLVVEYLLLVLLKPRCHFIVSPLANILFSSKHEYFFKCMHYKMAIPVWRHVCKLENIEG